MFFFLSFFCTLVGTLADEFVEWAFEDYHHTKLCMTAGHFINYYCSKLFPAVGLLDTALCEISELG